MESMIANSNAGQLVLAADPFEQSGALVAELNMSMQQPSFNITNGGQGSVAILWDIENCPVPSDVRPEDVAGNIRMALRVHPIIRGAITIFSAYGDFNAFPRRVREGCQRTGVKLVDVPNGRKDAADKAILVDMFLFALDNRPPSYIMLISGDVDFAPALHILGQRGYTVILVIPSGVGVSSALSNAGRFVWDWPSVARGEGFVPSTRYSPTPRSELAGYFMGCHISDNPDFQDEEAIVYRGVSQSFYNSRDFSVVSQSLSEYTSGNPLALRSQSLPYGTNDVVGGSAASTIQNEGNWWVQPGNVNGLKGQLVKLLELSGGCMTIARVPAEYQKLFGRPLYMSEYGAAKLVNLLKRMSDVMAVDGKAHQRFVYLRNVHVDPNSPGLVSSRKDTKGKSTQDDLVDANPGCGSSDELSDEERVVLEESNNKAGSKTSLNTFTLLRREDQDQDLERLKVLEERKDKAGSKASLNTFTLLRREDRDQDLERFKYELMEILVSYSCRIFLNCFEEIYRQRHKKPLDCRKLGANDLEELFGKMRDVVILREDPESKMKFLAAPGM